ncbi:hypothetical protein EXIGLDRAFT_783419 [Exidia glandulosa HHB12029]|uniref:Uncharacterized protein n=1 Tax=Exidia glandulosa HHB12029 TaxID=1314781 RepID=A0A166N2P0_EXIGL|nr:hypothetical protein EXIGLDRAFT_783419 [Exidia glandulosa HHB12029]
MRNRIPPLRGRLKILGHKAAAFSRLALNLTNAVADVNPILKGVTGGLVAVQRRYDISKDTSSDLARVRDLGRQVMLQVVDDLVNATDNAQEAELLCKTTRELDGLSMRLDSLSSPLWLHVEENRRIVIMVEQDILRLQQDLKAAKLHYHLLASIESYTVEAAKRTASKDDLRSLSVRLALVLFGLRSSAVLRTSQY